MFSTIAKPWMFGLGMTPKENFLTYLIQLIFLIIRLVPGNVVMVAIICVERAPLRANLTTGEWIYVITWKHVLAFTFFVYFFICLFNNIFTFLHLQCFICVSEWQDFSFYFKVPFIFKFIILKFITMLLHVNMRKFCK